MIQTSETHKKWQAEKSSCLIRMNKREILYFYSDHNNNNRNRIKWIGDAQIYDDVRLKHTKFVMETNIYMPCVCVCLYEMFIISFCESLNHLDIFSLWINNNYRAKRFIILYEYTSWKKSTQCAKFKVRSGNFKSFLDSLQVYSIWWLDTCTIWVSSLDWYFCLY